MVTFSFFTVFRGGGYLGTIRVAQPFKPGTLHPNIGTVAPNLEKPITKGDESGLAKLLARARGLIQALGPYL